jgi:hypothetical protein
MVADAAAAAGQIGYGGAGHGDPVEMNADSKTPGVARNATHFVRRLAIAVAAAGTLDIVYACGISYFRGRMPMAVLQSVASGWQGSVAYAGGVASALLGLVTHYGIMSVMALVFGVVAARLACLRERPLAVGPIYGLGLYAVMYGIVLPLRFPAAFPRLNGWVTVTDVIVHMAVGTIIAWVFSDRRTARPR